MASQKITRFVPLQVHLLEIRGLGSWNTSHYRGEDLSFFSSPSFLPMTFVYVCSENALNISGFLYFMRLATYECPRQTTISFANLRGPAPKSITLIDLHFVLTASFFNKGECKEGKFHRQSAQQVSR